METPQPNDEGGLQIPFNDEYSNNQNKKRKIDKKNVIKFLQIQIRTYFSRCDSDV